MTDLDQFKDQDALGEGGTRDKRNGVKVGEAFETAIFSSVDRRIQIAVRLLENNSDKQITLLEIARIVNLSPSRLAHLFKRDMELSMQQYLTQLRLAKAKRQLETSFLSVKEIAASVGFSSVARFVICFKNFVGSTPAQYRKDLPNATYRCSEQAL